MLLVANYREAIGTYYRFVLPSDRGFWLRALPSDRDISYQVTVDNLANHECLGGSGSSRRARFSDFLAGAAIAIRPFTGGRL
jgi:hypothetical protein